MSKAHDDMNPQKFDGVTPANDFPGAAEPNFSTYPARQNTGERLFPFSGNVPVYRPPASNLPMQVSAATVARENEGRWGNLAPARGRGPMLAGTSVEESDNK